MLLLEHAISYILVLDFYLSTCGKQNISRIWFELDITVTNINKTLKPP